MHILHLSSTTGLRTGRGRLLALFGLLAASFSARFLLIKIVAREKRGMCPQQCTHGVGVGENVRWNQKPRRKNRIFSFLGSEKENSHGTRLMDAGSLMAGWSENITRYDEERERERERTSRRQTLTR